MTNNTLLKNGAIATLAAIIINVLLFLIGSLFTFPDNAITPMGTPVSIAPVIITTLLGGLFATIGYLVLTKFMPERANQIMWVVAIIVLLGMAPSPFGITNVPVLQIIILEIMHIVAALPVYALTKSVNLLDLVQNR
ncbi:MAG TPA: DUF6069 family protein [Anaerolineae bacterium]|nr:DUF6069 family protein [Anaerolineae bacterium]